jgi:exonuclease SbcC
LEQVNRLANGQLESLSSGRYQLKAEGIDDKLKLTVIDRWNANEERPVETLSGGESFLTSLALALALSELSRGRSQLNSLFLDEGFGTLDAETLDIAIAALEGLRMQGRNIFLISHIRELTRRLPVKIEVSKKGNGSSSVDIRG